MPQQYIGPQDDMTPGQRLRDLIDAPDILVMPGIYDGFSARLAEMAGFKAAAISGAGVSESRLGWADVGIMEFEENLHACRAITACCSIPLRADADTVTAMRSTCISRCAGLSAPVSPASCWKTRSGQSAAATWPARRSSHPEFDGIAATARAGSAPPFADRPQTQIRQRCGIGRIDSDQRGERTFP